MSMSANWNIPPPTYDAPSTSSYMSTTLTPYLQLSHLLSLTWLAYPILSLIFVAFRLQLSLGDAQNAVGSAKNDLLASCKAAEQAATSTASMPRYMALASNRQFADAVNGSMNAARATLILALTVMEAIINFIVDIYRSTFLCFLELVIRGGLAILIGAVQEINNILETVTSGLRTSIQSDISGANNVIKSAIDAINKVNPFGNITPPQITVPSLDSLQNISLPASFTDTLTKLNASLPSIADIKGKIDDIIDTPFELLKKDINDTFAGINFDPDGLPVPELTRLSFCDDLDSSVIDDIGRDFIKIAKIGVVILVLLALLLIGLNCLLTWYKWRCMKSHLQYTREAWISDPTMVHSKPTSSSPQITMSDHNLLMLQANSEHPLITKITNKLSAKFNLTPAQHTNTQWFFNYIFHAPALACFLIGFFGLLSVEIQLLSMGPLVSKYQDRAASTVTDFSTLIATNINNSMYNQSSLYANDINGRVDVVQSTINNGLFGWVNGTTTTLNDTINAFYDDIQDAVNTVFSGTILESPINEFLKCFIGSKVDAIENALTFLHDNLNVDIPRVNQSALVLSPESINEASQPIAAAAIGGGGNGDEGLIGRLLQSYAASLKKERVMFGIFMGLWGFVIFMGLCIIAWHSIGRPYLEKRGRKKWQAEQRTGIDTFGSYRTGSQDEKRNNISSFSPLPSPRGSAFKPFWGSRSNSPSPTGQRESPSASQESVTQNNTNTWEPSFPGSFPEPAPEPAAGKKTGAKLLAIGRKAIRRERLKKDGSEEEQAVPLSPSYVSAPVGSGYHNGNTAWYSKMTNLLARKQKPEPHNRSVDFWNPPAMTETDKDRPKLQIYTQRALDKYGPPPRRYDQQPLEPQPNNDPQWPVSPGVPRPAWGHIMSPTPAVVVSQEPESPMASNFPRPPIGVPIRPRQHVASLPNDVGPVYEESIRRAPPPPLVSAMPIPLYNGFDNQHHPRSHPLHPHLEAYGRKRQGSSPPPPLKSPRMLQPQMALAPPPHPDRHRRSSSMGTTSQWRVTNAVPGESSRSSTASSEQDRRDENMPTTPVTRLLTTTHARQSSNVNPFITPFDDEHRVVIDYPTGPGARKSIPTNPFVHAM